MEPFCRVEQTAAVVAEVRSGAPVRAAEAPVG
jgi:hypothetical protein